MTSETNTSNTINVPLPEEARFALDYADAINRDAPLTVQLDEEREAVELATEIEDINARLMVLHAVARLAHDRRGIDEAIARGEDQKYGTHVIETDRSDMGRAAKRMLLGKNPAVIIRANQWQDVDPHRLPEIIASELAPLGDMKLVRKQQFPNSAMPGGSTHLHLDNFLKSQPQGFRYTLTASQIEEGNVLFFVGSAEAQDPALSGDLALDEYEKAEASLNQQTGVRRLVRRADRGHAPAWTEIRTKGGIELTAVALGPGDVVVWPQGGPGSEKPSWHGFRKIGQAERYSTSYHFVQQPEEPSHRS